MRLRSNEPLKGCDQPESNWKRKECATATALQTWCQLPVQGCRRQVKNRNQRKKRGGGKFFFHYVKGKPRGVSEAVVRTEERKDGRTCVPSYKATFLIWLWKTAEWLDSPPPPPPSFDLLVPMGVFLEWCWLFFFCTLKFYNQEFSAILCYQLTLSQDIFELVLKLNPVNLANLMFLLFLQKQSSMQNDNYTLRCIWEYQGLRYACH